MPSRSLKQCARHGCNVLTRDRFCPPHAAQARVEDEALRGNATARGYGSDWRRLAAAHLKAHPYCVGRHDPPVLAVIVDHIVPHRGDERLRLDPANLQSVCRSCHTKKTSTEGPGHRAGVGEATERSQLPGFA